MTDYEMLSLVIMIFMLVLAVMSYYKHDKQNPSRHPARTVWRLQLQTEGRSSQQRHPFLLFYYTISMRPRQAPLRRTTHLFAASGFHKGDR